MKVVEYFSSVYLASILLKQRSSKKPEPFNQFGILQDLEKSFDFSFLPY